jgi:small ligand-binding sensory domain FIST
LDRIMEDAADRLEELVDRCARYADEIAVLRENLGDIPLIGLAANGEIAGRHLHSFSGVLTIFL